MGGDASCPVSGEICGPVPGKCLGVVGRDLSGF